MHGALTTKATAQRFTLWQQGSLWRSHAVHSNVACLHHMHMHMCYSSHTSHSRCITH